MDSSKVRKRRWSGSIALAALSFVVLSGCFPLVDLAQEQRVGGHTLSGGQVGGLPEDALVLEGDGSQVQGEISQHGTETAYFHITERSAVALGAYSPVGEDLQMRLVGGEVDVYLDDGLPVLEAFSFSERLTWLDPTIAEVLDPGTYRVDLTVYQARAADFVLELRTSTQIVTSGETVDLSWGGHDSRVLIASLDTGDEVLRTLNSSGDPMVWVSMPGSSVREYNDDGGDGFESLVDFGSDAFDEFGAVDVVVIVRSHEHAQSGSTQLSLQ